MSAQDDLDHIHNLLSKMTDEDLRRFCYDTPGYEPVYDRLGKDTGRVDVIDRLIEDDHLESKIETLLTLAERLTLVQFDGMT